MAPRTILYTGKGGVGKTSVAAATARRCAAAGMRTVVLSTDPAHSLSDSLEADLGTAPTPAGKNLWGQEVQAQEEMERHWEAVQDWMGEILAERGVDRRDAAAPVVSRRRGLVAREGVPDRAAHDGGRAPARARDARHLAADGEG